METFKLKEETLFAKWVHAYMVREGISADEFAYDGLLFRGECKKINGFWEMQPGNETELWNVARRRLLILTKDTTVNGGMDDIRKETAHRNHNGMNVVTSSSAFYRNLTLWSYALLNAFNGGEILRYDDTPDWDSLREIYTTAPIARVNCKKKIGISTISNSNLKAHIERYAEFLKEQIKMYDANIILCCGGSGTIKNFVKRYYLSDLVRFSDAGWVYYSPETRSVLIDSYHPSSPKNMSQMYEQMMSDVKNFLIHFSEFRTS